MVLVNRYLKENDLVESVVLSPVLKIYLLNISDVESLLILPSYCSCKILLFKISNWILNLNVEYIDKFNAVKANVRYYLKF